MQNSNVIFLLLTIARNYDTGQMERISVSLKGTNLQMKTTVTKDNDQ